MNILRIVYDFPPPWWGLAPGPYELSKAQVKLGNKVIVFAGEWPRQKGYQEGDLIVERLPLALPYVSLYFTYGPSILGKYLFEHKNHKVDILHGHTYHPIFYHYYRKWFKDSIPYVFHMNITSAERAHRHKYGSFITKNFDWPLAIKAEKLGCKLANAIICVSESVKEEVLKWYKPNLEKVFVIPNGVNTELFNPVGSNLRKELRVEDSKVILFVGRLYKNKNVNLLIESLRYLPENFKLLVVGEGQDKENLIKLAHNLKLHKRIIFTGFIPYQELAKYYRTANIFVLPSTLEGFPKVVLEALASGLPVVTSKCFKADKYLSKHIVQIEDVYPQKIAGKIQEIIQKKHKVNIEEVNKNYNWMIIANRIQKIYQILLK
ncbi:MAG: glycosyltransferase family 4 protein [Candidatus Helarchaeota archaeon]